MFSAICNSSNSFRLWFVLFAKALKEIFIRKHFTTRSSSNKNSLIILPFRCFFFGFLLLFCLVRRESSFYIFKKAVIRLKNNSICVNWSFILRTLVLSKIVHSKKNSIFYFFHRLEKILLFIELFKFSIFRKKFLYWISNKNVQSKAAEANQTLSSFFFPLLIPIQF